MAKPLLVFATVIAKARSYWTCDGCGSQAQGDTVTVESQSLEHTPAQMGVAMYQLCKNVSNSKMPVGWSSHLNDKHLCPNCKE